MASHGYTYVPSKDVSPNVRLRDQQIRAMDMNQLRAYVSAMHADVNATYTKFQRLCTYNEMIEQGQYWVDFRKRKQDATSIRKISNLNLYRCTRELEGMPPKFFPLLERLEKLPWMLKHNTKPTHIKTIKSDHIILSLTEIHRRGLGDTLKGGTEKGSWDDKNIHNEDFVFFRLACGLGPAHSRFGPECLIFVPDQLFKIGWISLFDMLKPDSTDRMAVLHELDFSSKSTAPLKKNPFVAPLRSISSDDMQIHTKYPKKGGMLQRPRTLHRAEIVFYGPDIRRGIACSVLFELMQIGGPDMLSLALKAEDEVLARIVSNLFWIEAKVPRFFQFEEHQLLAAHSNVPYTKSTFE